MHLNKSAQTNKPRALRCNHRREEYLKGESAHPPEEEARVLYDRLGMKIDAIQSLMPVVEGMKTETNFFLGLGVPESDRGVETIIFG
jgi:hypothetical protein